MSTSPARLLRSPLAIRRANGSTLLLLPEWSLACQSGLRRCRHTSTMSVPLPCCYALARQLSNSRPLSTSVVLLYSWQASAHDSGRIIHTGTVRHAAAAAAAQARRRRRRRRQRHTGWLVQGGLKRDRRLPARGAPTAPPSMYSLAQ